MVVRRVVKKAEWMVFFAVVRWVPTKAACWAEAMVSSMAVMKADKRDVQLVEYSVVTVAMKVVLWAEWMVWNKAVLWVVKKVA